jgi:hypothetical protein
LPNDFGQAGDFVGQILSGQKPLDQLLFRTDGSGFNTEAYNPWPGYSRTAGKDYDLLGVPMPAENAPQLTGIVPLGGIPALDALIRPWFYANGQTPQSINAQAIQNAQSQGIEPATYNGGMAAQYLAAQAQSSPSQPPDTVITPPTGDDRGPAVGGGTGTSPFDDPGIIPTPTGN